MKGVKGSGVHFSMNIFPISAMAVAGWGHVERDCDEAEVVDGGVR